MTDPSNGTPNPGASANPAASSNQDASAPDPAEAPAQTPPGSVTANADANGPARSAATAAAVANTAAESRVHGLELLYLALAVAGAVLPWLANLDYMRAYPGSFDIGQFIALANVNPAAQSLSRDLAIGSSAVLIWIVAESRRLRMRGLWLVLLCTFTLAFACAAPLFLYLRERRLRELARQAVQA
jgi:hypothetical protein